MLRLLFLGSLVFPLLTSGAVAEGFKESSVGNVKSVTDKEIVLEIQGETRKFLITQDTKICVDGYQTRSWQKWKKAEVATVTTKLGSDVAIRIDNRLLDVEVGGPGGYRPILPECKANREKPK